MEVNGANKVYQNGRAKWLCFLVHVARLERLSVLCGISSLGSHWQSLEKYS